MNSKGSKSNQKTLGDRIKGYENVFRQYLPKRMAIISRIDGCHFHSYTKGMKRPFDEKLSESFWEAGKYLASQISGFKLGYHQSDEFSFLITNNDTYTTEPWFDNNIQKIVSVASSIFTAKFNEVIHKPEYYPDKGLATFDCRVFVVPEEEVVNSLLFRQRDATKNSISMLAQHHFSAKELHGVNGKQAQDMLFKQKGINWNDLPTWQKRGTCIVKEEYVVWDHENKVDYISGESQITYTTRHRWKIDNEIPIFSEHPEYITKLLPDSKNE